MIKKPLGLYLLSSIIYVNSSAYAAEKVIDYQETLKSCFPGHDINTIEGILEKEAPLVAVPVVSGVDVGYNFNELMPLHYKMLQQVNNKTVLEIGPGGGYMTAKILAAGAAHVDAIEYSAPAAQQIPRTVQRYATVLGVDLQSRLTITTGNVLDLELKPQFYDCAVLFNICHLQTPPNVIKILNIINPSQRQGDALFITMNAPSSESFFVDTFKREYARGSAYPGYMQKHRVDVQLYETDPEGNLVKLIKKEKTFYQGASPLSEDSPVSPMKMEAKGYTIVERNGSQATVHTKINQPSFFGDTRTITNILNKTGYDVIDKHYFNSSGKKFSKLDLILAKTETFGLAIEAVKK